MVDIRVNGVEPIGQCFVYFPFGVGPTSFESTRGDGENDVQMIRILWEPQESTGLQPPLEQCLDVLARAARGPGRDKPVPYGRTQWCSQFAQKNANNRISTLCRGAAPGSGSGNSKAVCNVYRA